MTNSAEPVVAEQADAAVLEGSPQDSQATVAGASGNGKLGLVEPDLNFIRELRRLGGESFKRCFQCATCSATCPISPDLEPFPRKEMAWAMWGMKDKLAKDPDIWLCYQCNDCSTICPRGGRPGDVLAVARNYSFQHYSVPGFMGKLLATPKGLPVLIGIPVALILLLQAVTVGIGIPEGEIKFAKFFPHYVLDPAFIAAVLFAGIAAVVGVRRFWQDMKSGAAPLTGKPKLSFGKGVVEALKEVFTHVNFRQCESASPRHLSHLLTFYGFGLLFLVTSAVFLGLYSHKLIPGFPELTPLPMPLWHPVKIAGNVGALLFAAGLGMMVYQRVADRERAGASNYQDILFLGVMCLLAVTGIGVELARLVGLATLAYSTYFVHLVGIFFLLAYLPYSKFAHILYRTVAIAYAKQTGRM